MLDHMCADGLITSTARALGSQQLSKVHSVGSRPPARGAMSPISSRAAGKATEEPAAIAPAPVAPILESDEEEVAALSPFRKGVEPSTEASSSLVVADTVASSSSATFKCVVCGMCFERGEVVNAGSGKYPSWRCRPHHATIKRLENACESAEEKKAFRALRKNKAAFFKQVIQSTIDHEKGETQKGENKRFVENLVQEMSTKDQQSIKWVDAEEYVCRMMRKRGMTESQAQESLAEAQSNPDIPKRRLDGRDLIGLRGTPTTVFEQSTRYTRGVEEGAQRLRDGADTKRARERIKSMTGMGVGSLAWGGTGGEYFAPASGALVLQDQEDGDSTATPSKRRHVDEGLLAWEEKRVESPAEVPLASRVTLARAELEEKVVQALDRAKRLSKRVGVFRGTKDVEEAIKEGKVGVDVAALEKTISAMPGRLSALTGLHGSTTLELKERVEKAAASFAALEEDFLLCESNLAAAEASVSEVKKELAKARRQATRQGQVEALKRFTAVIPDQWPGALKSDAAQALAGISPDGPPSYEDELLKDEAPLNVMCPKGPLGEGCPWHARLEGVLDCGSLGASMNKLVQRLAAAPNAPGTLKPVTPTEGFAKSLEALSEDDPPIGAEGFARPWLCAHKPGHVVAGTALPYNGLGCFIRGIQGYMVLTVASHSLLAAGDTNMIGYLASMDNKAFRQGMALNAIQTVVLHQQEWMFVPPGYHMLAFAYGGREKPADAAGCLLVPFVCRRALASVVNSEFLLQAASVALRRRSGDKGWAHTAGFSLDLFAGGADSAGNRGST